MKKITFLYNEEGKNTFLLLFPLRANRVLLRRIGIDVVVAREGDTRALKDSSVVGLTGRYYRNLWHKDRQALLDLIDAQHAAGRAVLWFDTTASTGTAQFHVMPHVDGYYKAFLLKDRERYLRPFYSGRLFSEYYHEKFNIDDVGDYQCEPVPSGSLDKLFLGWNYALGDFGSTMDWNRRLWGKGLPTFPYSLKFSDPAGSRSIDVSCRLSVNYDRATVRFQRDKILQLMESYPLPKGRVKRSEFLREMRSARVAVSPFGWGEYSYRDFEVIAAGATMLKADMSHLDTWPNFYQANETYQPYQWDCSDFSEKLDRLLEDVEYARSLAENSQTAYREVLYSDAGRNSFCDKVVQIVERHAL